MKLKSILSSILLMTIYTSCNNVETGQPTDDILIDQCGYLPQSPKIALVTSEIHKFCIIDENKQIVLSGRPEAAQYYAEAGEKYRKIDFSEITKVGSYTLVANDTLLSFPINISEDVYTQPSVAALKAFYFNRASTSIDQQYAGQWARPAGHPDTCVMIHKSAASIARPEGKIISSPRGWYDAGDYNKYIVNSGISTYTLMLAATMFEQKAINTHTNIPETGNLIPDIWDETIYNLRWMLTMQDPNDGGVYHKLTTLAFEGFIMPHECKSQRYVVAKGTAATLDFAATMAFASRHITKYDQNNEHTALADSCLKAAKLAYNWALNNPNITFRNPSDVSTGEYGDYYLADEWFWASTEMWLATNDNNYTTKMKTYEPKQPSVPSWGNVSSLGYYSMILDKKTPSEIDANNAIITLADSLTTQAVTSPICTSMTVYDWGSNSTVANIGMIKIIAYKLSGEKKYFNSALEDVHYLFGRNATKRCFMTGVGVNPPLNIHHRISAADTVAAPIPGLLCGGPNIVVPTDCPDDTIPRSQYPAKSYADQLCSYSTNEIAINWNAPLVFLLWGIEER